MVRTYRYPLSGLQQFLRKNTADPERKLKISLTEADRYTALPEPQRLSRFEVVEGADAVVIAMWRQCQALGGYRQYAESIGVAPQQVLYWLRGIRPIPAERARVLGFRPIQVLRYVTLARAKALGVDVDSKRGKVKDLHRKGITGRRTDAEIIAEDAELELHMKKLLTRQT